MADADVIATTARVVVRPWRVADADRFFDMYRRPEVTDWLGARPMVDRDDAIDRIGRITDRLAVNPRYGSWAVTYVANHRSARVCNKLGMRLLGMTHRWYDHPSLMFWIGAHPDQRPSIEPDEPAPT
jgi:RimJ/RimL family protein N-acetyltransferase